MNYRIVARYLGTVAILLAASMSLSLPWGMELLGGKWDNEFKGVRALAISILISLAVGAFLLQRARNAGSQFFRKEAMAVVALSWLLATLLGALPYLISGTLRNHSTPMSIGDALFESQSGFSTTGATVLGELEDPGVIPRCILFWRATTHFLGGLGIMVLFVAILGHSSAGKVFMKLEMSGKETGTQTGMHQTAVILFYLYSSLCLLLTVLLIVLGLAPFDALCHAFSTVATGGFSTFNASVGHFASHGYRYAAAIEWTLILFMYLCSCNFLLLFAVVRGEPLRMVRDAEWRFFTVIVMVTAVTIFGVGMYRGDFDAFGTSDLPIAGVAIDAETGNGTPSGSWSFRNALFQVVSTISTTGFCTDDYEEWAPFSYGLLLVLMFIGGCAGSTSGGGKVIRVLIAMKVIAHEVERSYRPNVVRPLLLNEKALDKETIHNVLVFIVTLGIIAITGPILLVAIEPASTWQNRDTGKNLIDALSAVAATLNNVGPGFGVIGAKGTYGMFTELSKLIFTLFMMIGRLEVFVVLSLFHPTFWKKLG